MATGQKMNNATAQGCSTATEDGGILGYNTPCCGIRRYLPCVWGGYGCIPPLGNLSWAPPSTIFLWTVYAHNPCICGRYPILIHYILRMDKTSEICPLVMKNLPKIRQSKKGREWTKTWWFLCILSFCQWLKTGPHLHTRILHCTCISIHNIHCTLVCMCGQCVCIKYVHVCVS